MAGEVPLIMLTGYAFWVGLWLGITGRWFDAVSQDRQE